MSGPSRFDAASWGRDLFCPRHVRLAQLCCEIFVGLMVVKVVLAAPSGQHESTGNSTLTGYHSFRLFLRIDRQQDVVAESGFKAFDGASLVVAARGAAGADSADHVTVHHDGNPAGDG